MLRFLQKYSGVLTLKAKAYYKLIPSLILIVIIFVAFQFQQNTYALSTDVISTAKSVSNENPVANTLVDTSGFSEVNSRVLIGTEIPTYDVEIPDSFSPVEKILSDNYAKYQEQQRQAKIRSEVASRGSMGRLYSPSIGIDVALFRSQAQSVCDARDSACYFYLGGSPVIADHTNQGFNRIRSAVPGSTLFYISDGNTVTTYRCIASYNGRNTGYDLTDESGVPASSKYPGSTILYTCRQDWQHVSIVHIAPIS